MQINQLRYVLKIAEKKSFSAAAKELYIAQPSLSQQISKLEKELGIPLFIRHSKSVSLTDAGERFIKSAERIINSTDQLSELMHRYSCLKDGTMRVGMLWVAGYLKLPLLLTNYRKINPGISFDLTIDGSESLLNALLSKSLNVIFIIGQEELLKKNEELYYQQILDDYYVAVLHKNHPLAAQDVLHIQDLQGQDFIMPSRKSAFYNQLKTVLDARFVTPHVVCETSQADVGIQLAAQGLAIYLSSHSIAQNLKDEHTKILPLDVNLHRTIYYVTLKELLDYPLTQSFTSFIRHYPFKKAAGISEVPETRSQTSKGRSQSTAVQPIS